jgi:hypothetical protein
MASLRSRKKPLAAGSYAGFSLQATRTLIRLLAAQPGDVVSLEVLDDVAITSDNGKQIVEQDKWAPDDNPASNRAIGLWKTLSNWVAAVETGRLIPESTFFELFVSHRASGSIVNAFSKASNSTEATEAYEAARLVLWGSAPTFDKKGKLADGIEEYVNHFFSADPKIVKTIIQRFSLVVGTGTAIADIEKSFGTKFVSNFNVAKVATYAHGWLKSKIDELHEQGLPAQVSQEEFHLELMTFVRKVDRHEILTRFAASPTTEEIDADLATRVYVRQLDLIESDYDDRIAAVRNYLTASADRTTWSELGLVNENSFDEFETSLKHAWKNHKRASDIELMGRDDISRGKHLYSKCCLHTAKLEGNDSPEYFTSGSFHALSDELEIGWHPNFNEELKN